MSFLSDGENYVLVNNVCKKYSLGPDVMKRVLHAAHDNFKKGLRKQDNADACIKMLPTYVTSLPNGSEAGTFVALDLGGTNFRVLLIKIPEKAGDNGKKDCNIDSRIYRVPKDKMEGTANELFDHIATCIQNFVQIMGYEEKAKGGDEIPLGFTFSFPCRQESLDSAVLMNWTKGFNCEGAEGEDVGKMLKDAMNRRQDMQSLKIVAICNDTVGTQMSCAFEHPDCKIGLIMGTGTNACYIEKTEHIEMLTQEVREQSSHMIINTEWGNFGADGALDFIVTEFDREVDSNTHNKGRQIFEKLMAGMYLGEIVRLIMRRLFTNGLLFHNERVPKLFDNFSIDTSFLSMIEDCDVDDIVTIQNIIAMTLDIGALRNDCEIVHQVCKVVSNRSAKLCACAISALALKIGDIEPDQSVQGEGLTITCGVDGSVFRKHPTFATELKQNTSDLLKDNNIRVKYTLSHDGSGKGAALTVAVASRLAREAGDSV
jgi:hexokinase